MQPHRSSALYGAAAVLTHDSGTHAWCGHATVMVLVSSALGPRVSGCPPFSQRTRSGANCVTPNYPCTLLYYNDYILL